MATGKNKYRVLAAGCNDKICEFITDLLPRSDYEPLQRATTAGEARRIMIDTDMDLVIINAPLKDEFGTHIATDLADDNIGVLLLVPADVYEQVCSKVEDSGVVTLPKPMSRQSFYLSVRVLTALRGKLLRMDQKNRAMQEKMMDIRIVNRAKWLLIEHNQMSENEAHYYIERQAMNLMITRREAAERIIHSFDPQ